MLEPFLVVGLGNIGSDYDFTRHNVGFMMLDEVSPIFDRQSSFVKFKGECVVVSFKMHDGDIVKGYILKPHTFMNLSGESVRPLCDYYKIPFGNVFVIHDDVDLPLGTVRVKKGGGDAGHNGLKSITSHLGTNDYYRLRVGVGRPSNPSYEMKDWVLSKFSNDEKLVIVKIAEEVRENFYLFVSGNFARFQEKINSIKTVLEK